MKVWFRVVEIGVKLLGYGRFKDFFFSVMLMLIMLFREGKGRMEVE